MEKYFALFRERLRKKAFLRAVCVWVRWKVCLRPFDFTQMTRKNIIGCVPNGFCTNKRQRIRINLTAAIISSAKCLCARARGPAINRLCNIMCERKIKCKSYGFGLSEDRHTNDETNQQKACRIKCCFSSVKVHLFAAIFDWFSVVLPIIS